jgi:hypothetical protein
MQVRRVERAHAPIREGEAEWLSYSNTIVTSAAAVLERVG